MTDSRELLEQSIQRINTWREELPYRPDFKSDTDYDIACSDHNEEAAEILNEITP